MTLWVSMEANREENMASKGRTGAMCTLGTVTRCCGWWHVAARRAGDARRALRRVGPGEGAVSSTCSRSPVHGSGGSDCPYHQ
jgi:hypothetical protein